MRLQNRTGKSACATTNQRFAMVKASKGEFHGSHPSPAPGISDRRRLRLALSHCAGRRGLGCSPRLDPTRITRASTSWVRPLPSSSSLCSRSSNWLPIKLPSAPSRTAPPGLIARIVLGALCGAALAAAGTQSIAIGAVLGCGGRHCRRVWRLSSSHSPGKSAESSGLRDRYFGRRGGDWRGIFHRVAILIARLSLHFNKRSVVRFVQ